MAKTTTTRMAPRRVNRFIATPKSGVGYVCEELQAVLEKYETIKDAIAGEIAVKAKGVAYLPMPNASDTSPENVYRYNAYVSRAVFYNVSGRTHKGMVGQIFMREPQVEVPAVLDPLVADITGSGVSLEQLAKSIAEMALDYGRCGVLADYPAVAGPQSKEDLEKKNIRPTITAYKPWDCINWRTITRGGKKLLSLVVLREDHVVSDDGFTKTVEDQYRVLRLVGDVYTVEIWRGKVNGWTVAEGPYTPAGADGNPFDEIPFVFVGSVTNDPEVDEPPMFDLAALNMAHFRNSADYEESCFMVGQPTPVFSGLTESWVKEVLDDKIFLGSRGAVLLPENGKAELLQAEPNTMPMEAMVHKEGQMVALGAKLVEEKTVQRTATEANQDEASETSTLASVAKNVSNGVKWMLEWCSIFVSGTEEGIEFELNTEFDLTKMSAGDRAQLIKEWQAGAITFEEMRGSLRRAGVATLDDAAAIAALDEENAKRMEQDAERIEAEAKAASAGNPAPVVVPA
jgi:hypothetical protein